MDRKMVPASPLQLKCRRNSSILPYGIMYMTTDHREFQSMGQPGTSHTGTAGREGKEACEWGRNHLEAEEKQLYTSFEAQGMKSQS